MWAAKPVAQGGGGANVVTMSFGADGGFAGENTLDGTFSPATFPGVTALLFSCALPTLFFGNCVAAYAPPPRTMKRHSVEMTLA